MSRRLNRVSRHLVACLMVIVIDVGILTAEVGAVESQVAVSCVSSADRARLRLPAFYKKMLDANGIPIIASNQVNDYALAEAHYIITNTLRGVPKLQASLADSGLRVAVMAPVEFTTDIPEHRDLEPKKYWDRRARGLGGTREKPIVSCGEENLLNYPGDPYEGENILIHEFAHSVHLIGMPLLDQSFDERLRRAYHGAMANDLWKGTYAAMNHEEYFAEGSQTWFECNAPPGKYHNAVQSRKELREYDPRLADLLNEAYGDTEWRYVETDKRRPPAIHLQGFQRTDACRFTWPASMPPLDRAATEHEAAPPTTSPFRP